MERKRTELDQSIETAGKVLEKAAGEVALTTAKKGIADDITGDRIGHSRLRKLCEEGGIPGYMGILSQVVSYPAQYPGRAPPSWTDGWVPFWWTTSGR